MTDAAATGRLSRLPTAENRQLLRAAVPPGDDAGAAWTRWRRAGGDLDAVSSAAFRLLGLIYRNLEAQRIEDPDLPRLKGVYRHTWVVNQRLSHRLGQAITALQRADVTPLILAGPAVSAAHYRDLGTRRIDDMAVLVAPADVARAARSLADRGFTPLSGAHPDRLRDTGHAAMLSAPDATRLRLHWRALSESADDEDYWAHAVPVTVGSAATLAPGPAQQLLHVCTDGPRSGPQALTWIADASLILHGAAAELDWAQFVDGAARRRVTLTTDVALGILHDVVGAPIRAEVPTQLARATHPAPQRLLMGFSRRGGPGAATVRIWDAYRRRRRS